MNLICNATGDPEPSITLTRLSDNTIVNSSFTITGKQDEGAYRCTADNGVGNAATADVFIVVQSKFISQVSILFPVVCYGAGTLSLHRVSLHQGKNDDKC